MPPRARAQSWNDVAPAVLAPRRRAAADALARLEGKVELARVLLSTVVVDGPRSRFGLEQAGTLLESALLRVGLARELFASDATWQRIPPRARLARREVAELRPVLFDLHQVLGRLARHRPAVRPTPGEIGDIDRGAEVAREALNIVEAMGDLLVELSADAKDGPLTAGDLQLLGLAFASRTTPPQALWDDEMVGALARLAVDASASHRAGRVSLAGVPGPVRGADLLVALRALSFDLAGVDPGQLRPAARYIEAARSPGEGQERLQKVVDALRVLAQAERPIWSRERMGVLLTTFTGIPARALLRQPEAEVFRCFQEIARAVNTAPGVVHVRMGRYDSSVSVDEAGRVVRSLRRSWGLLSEVAGAVGRTARGALATLRHYTETGPLGGLLTQSISTGESLSRGASVRGTRLASVLLRSAAGPGEERDASLHARLTEASRELEDVAVRAAAVRSCRAAAAAAARALRERVTALSAFDPAALARVNKQLQQAEETRRGALRECATRLLQADPAAAAAVWARGQAVDNPSAEEPRPRPSTTGGSIRGVVRQLRQTRMLVERVQRTATELSELAHRPGVPEAIRQAASASAGAVETAIVRFRQELTDADGEAATEAARIGLEQAVAQIFADHQQIQIALAAFPGSPARPAPAEPGSLPAKE